MCAHALIPMAVALLAGVLIGMILLAGWAAVATFSVADERAGRLE